jgi:hypothetical protein
MTIFLYKGSCRSSSRQRTFLFFNARCFHDKKGSTGYPVRQRTVRNHAVTLYRLVIVKRPDFTK